MPCFVGAAACFRAFFPGWRECEPLSCVFEDRMSFHNHITEILPLIGRHTDSVELIKRGNDVFRLVSGADHYFLKAYTKNWYGSDPATTGFHVIHERVAWAILAQHGLAVPTVMYTASDCENP